MSDSRLAVRALRTTPMVSAVAVLSLALGIGVNTAIVSLVDALLLRTLPVAEPERSRMTPPAIQTSISQCVSERSPTRGVVTRLADLGGAQGYSQPGRKLRPDGLRGAMLG